MKKFSLLAFSALCTLCVAFGENDGGAVGFTAPPVPHYGINAAKREAYPHYNAETYPQQDADEELSDFYDTWIKDRLSIGLTYYSSKMKKGYRPANTKEDFLGNSNELNNEKTKRVVPLIEYKICDYFGIGASYMRVEASTMNFNNGEGDGNAILKGPVFAAEASYPIAISSTTLQPHAGLGWAKLSGDFKEDTWWHLGYASPESWESLGSPTDKTRGNHYRYIEVDDASETFFTVGLSFIPHPHVKLDLSWRHIKMDPDCEFGYDYSPRGGSKHRRATGDFDLTSDFWLFSISYIF